MQLAELAQAQLAKLGITVVIDAADRSRYTPDAQAGNFDIYTTATALDLGALSLAQWYQTGAARNYFGYSSATVDKLVDEISLTLDAARTAELTNEPIAPCSPTAWWCRCSRSPTWRSTWTATPTSSSTPRSTARR